MLFFILGDVKSHTLIPFEHHFRHSAAVSLLVMTAETKLQKKYLPKSS
jgi:hypothetical protein